MTVLYSVFFFFYFLCVFFCFLFFFFQAEDGIRDLVRSRGLGDVYKRQFSDQVERRLDGSLTEEEFRPLRLMNGLYLQLHAYMLRVAIPYGTINPCLLYTSDAADERSSVDLGGRRIIKKKKKKKKKIVPF